MSASSKKKLRKEQNAAAMTEKQLAQQKEDKNLRLTTIGFVAVMILVVCIAVGALGLRAYNQSGIPERTTVAMTIGEHELSTAELNYFYMEAINEAYSNWYNQYGSYMSMYLAMYGLDLSQPLNAQYLDESTGYTWADYFVEIAVSDATNAYAQYDKAMADETFTLDETLQTALNEMPQTLKDEAKDGNYSSVQDYLAAIYGPGSTEESYIEFVEVVTVSNAYAQAYYDSLEYTADEVAAHDAEHGTDYNTYSFAYTYLNASNFRQGGTTAEDGTTTYSDDEIAAAVEAAKTAADSLTGATDLENFDQLIADLEVNAEKEDAASTKVEDSFLTNVNTLYSEWLSDSIRQVGDIHVVASTSTSTDADGNSVTTTNGYYVVFFNGCNKNEMKLVNVRHILIDFEPAEGSTTVTDADKLLAQEKANALLDQWKQGEATEDSFAALVAENTADAGSMATGGLYENVYPGQMVTNFNDWCFAEGRQAGDTGVVLSDYGYHIMYFVGHAEQTYRGYMINNVMKSEDLTAWTEEIYEAAEVEVLDTSKLSLDLIITPSTY